jgi:hypothetical protein
MERERLCARVIVVDDTVDVLAGECDREMVCLRTHLRLCFDRLTHRLV